MRTETTTRTLYSFDELSSEAQEHAIEKLYDLNVDYAWWQYIYADAENIGIKITGFDLDRNRHCKGEFMEYPLEVCRLIVNTHNNDSETYKLAETYASERNKLSFQESTRLCQDDTDQFCECFNYTLGAHDISQDIFEDYIFSDLDNEFHRDMLNEYASMLQHEYDYLTSKEQIIESIQMNEYEFTEAGDLA